MLQTSFINRILNAFGLIDIKLDKDIDRAFIKKN